MSPPPRPSAPPAATPNATVDALVAGAVRDHTPIRIDFLQRRTKKGRVKAGPMATFVSSGDRRGLLLFLLLLTKSSSELGTTGGRPWSVRLEAAVWARALDIPLPTTKAAVTAVSKTWLRLENRQLIERHRVRRLVEVSVCREDGTGTPYSHPGKEGGYFKLPHAFFTSGPGGDDRWYRVLTVPEIAFLLIASSHRAGFRLPSENGPDWYGISADTLQRGADGLRAKKLLQVQPFFKPAPLTAAGYTSENHYTLLSPFTHRQVKART